MKTILLSRWTWLIVFLGSLLIGARFSLAGNSYQLSVMGELAFIALVILVLLIFSRRAEPLFSLPILPRQWWTRSGAQIVVKDLMAWSSRYESLLTFLFYLWVVIGVSSLIFFRSGTLGLRDDWPIPPLRSQNITLPIRETLHSWGENYLGLIQDRQAGNYVDAATGLAARLGADGWLISRYPLFLLPLAGFLCWRLCRFFGLSYGAALAAGLVYILNPFTYSIFISGYLKFFVSLAALPAFIQAYEGVLYSPRHIRRLVSAAFLFGLVSSQINFFVLGGLYLLLRLGFELVTGRKIRLIPEQVIATVLVGLGGIVLQPALFLSVYNLVHHNAGDYQANLKAASASWVTGLSANLSHAWSGVGAAYTYYSDYHYTSEGLTKLWEHGRFLLLSFAALGLTAPKIRRPLVFAGWLFVIATLYVKGANPPFGVIFNWLAIHIPLLLVVRNTSYLVFLGSLGFALLIAFSVDRFVVKQRPFILTLFLLIFLTTIIPFFTRSFEWKVTPYEPGSDTAANFEFLRNEGNKSRILFTPMMQPMTYEDSRGVESAPGNNPFVLHPPRPSLWMGVDGGNIYTTNRYHAFIANLLNHGNSEELGRALAIADVSTVVLDQRIKSKYSDFLAAAGDPEIAEMVSRSSTISSLNAAKDLKVYHEEGSSKDYGNLALPTASLIRIGRPVLVTDGFELWRKSASGLGVNPSVLPSFAASGANQPNQLKDYQAAWFSEQSWRDLAFSKFHDQILEPGGQVSPVRPPDARKNWVATYVNQWWWYNPEYATIEDSVLTLSREKTEFTVTLPKASCQNCELWVKLYKGRDGSFLHFSSGDNSVGSSATFDPEASGWRWEKIYQGEPLATLTTSADPGENAIAAILQVEGTARQQAEADTQSGLSTIPIALYIDTLSDRSATVFELPKSGKFQPKLKIGAGVAGTLSLDGRSMTFSSNTFGFVDLPAQTLTAGPHRLTINSATPSVFPMSLDMHKASGLGTDPNQDGGVPITADGGEVLQLRASNGQVHSMLQFPHFSTDQVYRVSFDFRSLSGNPPTFAVTDQSEVKRGYKPLYFAHDWQSYNFVWTPKPGQTSAFLDLVAHKHAYEASTVNQFRNLTVVELPRVEALILTEAGASGQPTNQSAQVKKYNPTKYEATVSEPSLVTFLSANDPGWQATITGQKLTRGPVIAGFAPSWTVEEAGRVKLTFLPERPFQASLIASWLFFVIGGLSLTWRPKEKK